MDTRVFTVLRQEYMVKVRTRAFLLGTLLTPVIMGALTVLPALFMSMDVSKPTSLAVVDESGVLAGPLSKALDDSSKTGQKLFTLVPEPASGRTREQLTHDLGEQVTAEKIGGFILIPGDVLEGGEAAYYAQNVSDFRRNDSIQRALDKSVREVRISRSNLDPAQVEALTKSVAFTTFKVGAGGEARKDRGTTFGLAYAIALIFYISLLVYGIMMLRAALEEKTSRSAEVMVATVRSSTLMTGKILGIGAVGLTQLGIWAVLIAIFSIYSAATGFAPGGVQMSLSTIGLTFPIIFFFVVYFILGFLLYAAFFGAIGAMVSTETEAQQVQQPIMAPMWIALMLMFLAIRTPNAPLVRVASQIPFFSPMLMMVRITVQMPPMWEILLSLVLLAAAIAGALWVAGRIFRVGLLMYGKRPDLPELMKWIRYG